MHITAYKHTVSTRKGPIMILIYNLLNEKKSQIKLEILASLQKNLAEFSRSNRHELKESITCYLDSLLDAIASNNSKKLESYFRYLVRKDSENKHNQHIPNGLLVQYLLSIGPILRKTLQKEFRELPIDGKSLFNQGIRFLENLISQAVNLFLNIQDEYLKLKLTQQKIYLENKKDALGIDLSKFILFRG